MADGFGGVPSVATLVNQKYKIEFHPEDSPFHPDVDQESGVSVMPNRNGQKYICYLPKVEKVKSGKPLNQLNMSSMIVETGKLVKLKTPDELLEVLKDQCFIRQEGWWSYEFCYQKKLRQVHLEDDKVVQEFVLGVYDEEATAAFNQNLSDVSTLKDPHSKCISKLDKFLAWTDELDNLFVMVKIWIVSASGKTTVSSQHRRLPFANEDCSNKRDQFGTPSTARAFLRIPRKLRQRNNKLKGTAYKDLCEYQLN
ncbi:hypothetical protein GH714_011904 [Hevea brasiliensis]|uniref:Protein OS9-like domain-containing protein n=1 Tax=Hevea brasiliensis TaxID=3981 RepID=A0A6A6MX11_HEVBR|nr:hypothetical protein GH714_011904 [Hevea brasiliensis]